MSCKIWAAQNCCIIEAACAHEKWLQVDSNASHAAYKLSEEAAASFPQLVRDNAVIEIMKG